MGYRLALWSFEVDGDEVEVQDGEHCWCLKDSVPIDCKLEQTTVGSREEKQVKSGLNIVEAFLPSSKQQLTCSWTPPKAARTQQGRQRRGGRQDGRWDCARRSWQSRGPSRGKGGRSRSSPPGRGRRRRSPSWTEKFLFGTSSQDQSFLVLWSYVYYLKGRLYVKLILFYRAPHLCHYFTMAIW